MPDKRRMQSIVCFLFCIAALFETAGAVGYVGPMPDDAEYVNVREFGAVGDGNTDDTEAFEAVFGRHKNDDGGPIRQIYIPNGTYLVSDTIRWGDKKKDVRGQSRDGVVIRLRDHAPGFGDPDNPKPVLSTEFGHGAQNFNQRVRNLTVDVGIGNPGAVALNYHTNNHGGVHNVTLRSSDPAHVGHTGLAMDDPWPGPGLVTDVRIEGFDRGIYVEHDQYSMTFEDITLLGQRRVGLENNGNSLAVHRLTYHGDAPAVINRGETALLALLDAKLERHNTKRHAEPVAALVNRSGGAMFLRDVHTLGFDQAIEDRVAKGVTPPKNPTISEYVSHAAAGGPGGSLRLGIKDAPDIPWGESSTWANVVDFGAVPNDKGDDADAIQAAIDSGASTVYFPAGVFRAHRTLVVRGDVQRVFSFDTGRILFRVPGEPGFRVEDGADGGAVEIAVTGVPYVGQARVWVHHASTRPVILHGGSYENSVPGGEVFLQDVCSYPFRFRGQRVWARQLNPETYEHQPMIENDGGELWVLGLKTEKDRTVIGTVRGGKTEVLGGLLYKNRQRVGRTPAFTVRDASASLVYRNKGRDYDVQVAEWRDDLLLALLAEETPAPRRRVTLYRTHEHADEPGERVQGESKTWVVSQNHPEADDAGPGIADRPFESIAPATKWARPGDTVRVHAGVYRERVKPARGGEPGEPITYEAAKGERVVLRGSDVLEEHWSRHDSLEGVWVAPAPPEETTQGSALTSLVMDGESWGTLAQLFIDGKWLRELKGDAPLRRPGSWRYDPETRRIVLYPPPGVKDPGEHLVELSVRDRVFAPVRRGLGYITVRGFTMEHAANVYPRGFWGSKTPQAGMLSTRSGHHWVIENNTIRHAQSVGLDCGAEGRYDLDGLEQSKPDNTGHHEIRHNVISDNGALGIAAYRSYGTKIIGNVIERNNARGFVSPESAGIKAHYFQGGLIAGNLVRDNDAQGIWLDNRCQNARVTRNVLLRNRGAGVFVELTTGPIHVDNNVIALTTSTNNLDGDGIYAHDASGVIAAHNLIAHNANFGLWAHAATERELEYPDAPDKAPARCSNWRVVNNLFVGNHRGAVSLPTESPRSRNNVSDFNGFAGAYDHGSGSDYNKPLSTARFSINTNKGRVNAEAADKWLTLETWRRVTGHDVHSWPMVALRPNFVVGKPLLQLILSDVGEDRELPAVDGVSRDLLGRRWSPDVRRAGPLTNLRPDARLTGYDFSEGGDAEVDDPIQTTVPMWPLPITEPSGESETK